MACAAEETLSGGALVHSPFEILQCFVEYYRHLNLSHTITTHQEAVEFLSTIPLPTLTEDQHESLEQPIMFHFGNLHIHQYVPLRYNLSLQEFWDLPDIHLWYSIPRSDYGL